MSNKNSQFTLSGQINKSACGYFKDRTCSSFLTTYELFRNSVKEELSVSDFYYTLLNNGFRRYNDFYYINSCEYCHECIPIRIPVKDFELSKSQKTVWRKNCDLEVSLIKSTTDRGAELFVSDEKCALFRDYDAYHNAQESGYKKMTLVESAENLCQLVSGYSDVWNMEYRLDGRLVGVGVLDFAEDAVSGRKALSSNYFYYETTDEIRKRSIGVFSVLKEIELCRHEGIDYYYLGLYLPNCRKMSYKANYKPFELFLEGRWNKSISGQKEGAVRQI